MRYPIEVKAKVVEDYIANGLGPQQLVIKYDVGITVIHNWISAYFGREHALKSAKAETYVIYGKLMIEYQNRNLKIIINGND